MLIGLFVQVGAVGLNIQGPDWLVRTVGDNYL